MDRFEQNSEVDTPKLGPFKVENWFTFDPAQYIGVEEVNVSEFIIRHRDDEVQDVLVMCEVDEDSEIVEWDGLGEAANKRLR